MSILKQTPAKYIFILFFAITLISCEDNMDKDEPLLGKWRSETFVADVETNDSTATVIIARDIEKANAGKHEIMQYTLMTDSIFVLYNINSDYMATGRYSQKSDTIHFTMPDSCYWGIQTKPKQFRMHIEDMSRWYTPDSLTSLGVKNPETVVIKRARLFESYKWISS